jgi:hypothetical protein
MFSSLRIRMDFDKSKPDQSAGIHSIRAYDPAKEHG